MDTIEGRWILFRERHIAPGASPGQLHDMRIAFFAGAQTILGFTAELAELPDAAAVLELELLHREIRRFADSLNHEG